MRKIIKIACVYQLLLLLICLAGSHVVENFMAWDAKSYLTLATHGYSATGENAVLIVFFPLYPLLLRLVSVFLISPVVSGVVLTATASAIGHVLFFRLSQIFGYSPQASWKSLVLFFCSPIAVYFTLIYSEGVFLCFTMCFLYFLYQKKFGLAVVFGFLATLTRLTGVILVVPYVFYFLRVRPTAFWQNLSKGFLIPFGFSCYLILNWFYFGQPFHYQQVLREHWFKFAQNPLSTYVDHIQSIFHLVPTELTYHFDVYFTLFFPLLVALYCLRVKEKKLPVELIIWSVAQWLVITAQSFWLSNTRYIGLIISVYFMLCELTDKRNFLYGLILGGSTVLAVYGIYLFWGSAWLY